MSGLITKNQTLTVDKMKNLFNDNITTYGKGYAEEDRFYHPLVGRMQRAITDKNAELDSAKRKNRERDDESSVARAARIRAWSAKNGAEDVIRDREKRRPTT